VTETAAIKRICVAQPKFVNWNGNEVSTAIFKLPVTGKIQVTRNNLSGDQQADLTVHGGLDKAVYAYPVEQYAYWKDEYHEFEWGAFGENLTVCGFTEQTLCIGDQLKIGTALFEVTQPRMPCFKLGIRFNRPDMVKRFLQSGRTGFYFAVLEEGEVAAGDSIELLERDEHNIPVADVVNLYRGDATNQDLLRRVSELPSLPNSWRDYFRKRLWNPDD